MDAQKLYWSTLCGRSVVVGKKDFWDGYMYMFLPSTVIFVSMYGGFEGEVKVSSVLEEYDV